VAGDAIWAGRAAVWRAGPFHPEETMFLPAPVPRAPLCREARSRLRSSPNPQCALEAALPCAAPLARLPLGMAREPALLQAHGGSGSAASSARWISAVRISTVGSPLDQHCAPWISTVRSNGSAASRPPCAAPRFPLRSVLVAVCSGLRFGGRPPGWPGRGGSMRACCPPFASPTCSLQAVNKDIG
jgi:hypothetical protein